MPDLHQPDDAERAEAEAIGVGEETLPSVTDDVEVLRDERPSSRNDPNWPDRPKT
jgi:hypothetical protein